MNENPERIQQFKADVAAMKLRDPATSTDRLLGRLGVVGMLAGPGFAVAAWFISHGTRNPLQQRDAIVLGLLGLTVALVGTALWLKAALAGFLRFWMARLAYEQASRDDRLVAERSGDVVAAVVAPALIEVSTDGPASKDAPPAAEPASAAEDAVTPDDEAATDEAATDEAATDEAATDEAKSGASAG